MIGDITFLIVHSLPSTALALMMPALARRPARRDVQQMMMAAVEWL
jgi:hypothetical protein